MERLEKDFYAIEIDGQGKKVVHIYGYAYDTGFNDENPYRLVEFTFFIIPIEKFVNMTTDEIHNEECNVKTYIGDYGEEEIVNALDNYFDETPKALAFESVTLDTPCGVYIEE